MKRKSQIALLTPIFAIYGALLIVPLILVIDQSFRLYIPGRVGSSSDAAYTTKNYVELIYPSYFQYFFNTFAYGLISCVISLFLTFPVSLFVARNPSRNIRKFAIGFLISLLFLSLLARVYSLQLTFGPAGFQREISSVLGISPNSRAYSNIFVIAGLVHYVYPVCALTLIGPLQNLNPRLVEAAQALGAYRFEAFLTITFPLSLRAILSAFLICYTLCVSSFVLPMILGNGRVLFVSNLIYSRFSEIANYPSGAAISVLLVIISLTIFFLITQVASYGRSNRSWEG